MRELDTALVHDDDLETLRRTLDNEAALVHWHMQEHTPAPMGSFRGQAMLPAAIRHKQIPAEAALPSSSRQLGRMQREIGWRLADVIEEIERRADDGRPLRDPLALLEGAASVPLKRKRMRGFSDEEVCSLTLKTRIASVETEQELQHASLQWLKERGERKQVWQLKIRSLRHQTHDNQERLRLLNEELLRRRLPTH